ncbi:zinc ribbon domain-containing protein [Frigoriglobus tundricola]|uniref:Transglycosylase PBP1b N-terminal transmembrane domain-containing protein n=1 Tax=Frigoriglobus tundricola TaxID=2774151 RepID=A0A6M5YG92_9BACT|nr:hypothetical protein [Frigoriglobus tundricola]QJW93018.1 hypothetical protein FTUN_0518 [Frigoriglobus tundricola]
MANIRVTCPACRTELEVGAEHAGQEVECGNCLEVFVAKAPGGTGVSGTGPVPGSGPGPLAVPGSQRSKPANRPVRKRRRDDDDDYEHDHRRDDYDDYDDYAPSRRGSGGDGAATASLILGIFALVLSCCWIFSLPLGLSATITGGLGLKSQNNRGSAVAGLILGIISMCVAVFFLFFFVVGNAAGNRGQFR